MHRNEDYYWRVTMLDDTAHVSFTKSELTWEEVDKMYRKFAGECSSFRMDREGLIDG